MKLRILILVLLLSIAFLITSCITIVQTPDKAKEETPFKEKCEMPAGLVCDEFKVEPNKMMIKFTNKLGYRIGLGQIKASTCSMNPSEVSGGYVDNFNRYVAVLENCNNGNNGEIFNDKIIINYVPDEGDWQTATSTVTSKISYYLVNEYPHVLYYSSKTGDYYKTIQDKRSAEGLTETRNIIIKREYTHKINVIEPKISYDCTRLDVQSASDETVAICNTRNHCDKIEPYDLTVRKSATDAISQHLNQRYSTSQIIDVYAWAKNNIDYQNVPLDDFAPYRPSETIALKSGDCKNYAAVISSMILSIGGSARIVSIPQCTHAFAEVFIGKDYSLIENLAQEIKQQYQQDIEINVIKDSQGYWLILDGAGADYAGTTEIKECLNPNAERYYSYSCVSADGKINKQTYKKEYLSQAVSFLCDNCKSVNDCQPECKYVCIKADWVGEKGAKGYEVSKYLGLKTEVYCTCTCYK